MISRYGFVFFLLQFTVLCAFLCFFIGFLVVDVCDSSFIFISFSNTYA